MLEVCIRSSHAALLLLFISLMQQISASPGKVNDVMCVMIRGVGHLWQRTRTVQKVWVLKIGAIGRLAAQPVEMD